MAKISEEFQEILKIAASTPGYDHFDHKKGAYALINANKVVDYHEIEGVHIEAYETDDGVKALIDIEEGVQLVEPVHLCFGDVRKNGRQVIESHITVGRGAKVDFLAHCVFPHAEKFLHAMEGTVEVGEGANVSYKELHYHGPESQMEVRPVTKVKVNKGGRYVNDFTLVEGKVGSLDIDIDIDAVGEGSRVELTSKVYGKADDSVKIQDVVKLSGKNSSALIKTRTVLKDHSVGSFMGMIDGAAPGAKGHVDCTEVVQGHAIADASPVVRASHPEAEVTHEAAIGRIADDKIAGLMAKGLTSDEAIDMIVSGLLK
ncbi:MAG: SufD family Fe-S cluster assembly protein [Aminobacterium sp.]|uniref:SufB/SufD family protein n=1 Tax=Aminobacterium sp. TaxID=1872491 RepID=UPI001BCA925F|nr:SufD family Fe-S cluster assembly protein [Aminobacterium sp.]MDD2206110.1 SufD family Fe-S cluster assembly protein [Aminobacterium sp.]MDD3427107.1 SufD family Fe-S cluster assembly protein [Aminobacterium sp.]MDD3707829.1 SufD family Fe-S cluster assembly protein [Aminobacterium sp.]MDD4228046.1 SufD family Fe-S cluster assembly protein [Aminobacterium sp.]MDD4551107.1 SufD family Fe-S cluster assembly protein [Aminobacterium sp.]